MDFQLYPVDTCNSQNIDYSLLLIAMEAWDEPHCNISFLK